jgi:hypothetical protein
MNKSIANHRTLALNAIGKAHMPLWRHKPESIGPGSLQVGEVG